MTKFLRLFVQLPCMELGTGMIKKPLLHRASGPNEVMNDLMMGAHQNSDGTKTGSKEGADDNIIPADSACVDFELSECNEQTCRWH